ncbi:hypothetical protein VNO78_17531 [Psophocarpus tetragonolobus]|uniref:Uncharacterized protein n=1 Tax=Psophocarpus tetragonolobus TaxID=3891 RepID=A0AAN9SH32_PSOTE
MEPMPDVLDVSSGDEEDEVVFLEDKMERIIDFDWVKEFLGIQDEDPNELNKPQHKSKSSVLTAGVKCVDDDDDCVVLDGDPETRVTMAHDSPTGSDDLVVVGEKGQCHCYVCDSVAPCLKWGTGFLGTDHCHATDKSETWRTLRKNFMFGQTAPLLASTNYSTLGDVRIAQQNHIPPLGIMLLSPNSMLLSKTSMSTATHTGSSENLMPQNQTSRPIIMRTCSSLSSSSQNQVSRPNTVPEGSIASNFTIPSGTNYGRYRESGSALVREGYQSQSFPQNLLGVRNHAIQRVRQHGVSSLGPQLLRSHTMLNRLGSVGVGSYPLMNHSIHGASGGLTYHVNPAQQYARYRQNDVYAQGPPNFLFSNPCSQPNNLISSVSKYTAAHETQAYYQSNGSQNFSGYSVQGSNASSCNVAGLSQNKAINEPLIGGQNDNPCGNVTQIGTGRQYFCQQKHYDCRQIESALKSDFSTFDSSRVEDMNQSIPSKQSSRSMNLSFSAKKSGTEFTGSKGLGSVDDIKRWLFNEEDSVLVGSDGALASELNMPSPDPSTFDVGTLFDFEKYWDCVAHV